MRISIVIPTYNCARYLKTAIQSVLSQSYPDKEIIVIDGGSNDDTVTILESYGDSIKWISEKDNGQADAINKGFRMATGDIVAWLNADDWYEPDIFEEISEVFATDDEIAMVYGNCTSVFEEGDTIVNTPPRMLTVDMLISQGNFVFQPASFYRRLYVEKVGLLDDSFNFWMEYDLNIKLLKSGKAAYINKFLANFLVRSDQKSDLKNIASMDKELYLISRLHGGGIFSRVFWVGLWHRIK